MKTATLAQRDKLWEVVDQNGTPREKVQRLITSGLFSDLLEANLGQRIDRDEFRRFLGLKPLEYIINVDYDFPLQEAIGYLDIGSCNCGITSSNFPQIRKGKTSLQDPLQAILFRIDSKMGTDEVIRKMDEKGLRPVDLRELIAFGGRYRNFVLQHRVHVFALGQSYKPTTSADCSRMLPGLVLSDWPEDNAALVLIPYDEEWTPEDCRFLAVPK